MKFLILLFFVTLATVHCYIGILGHDPNDKHPGYCYTKEYGLGSMKNGEERRIKSECAIARCKENKDIKITGCAPVAVEPPCNIGQGNLSKPFPDCCFEIQCPDNLNKL